MAEFTITEFQDFFRDIGKQYGFENVEHFIDSVTSDVTSYFDAKDDRKYFIPQKFYQKEMEYLILFHFARHFLDGVRYNLQINKTLSHFNEISRVSIETDHNNSYQINIGNFQTSILEKDYDQLRNMFILLGNSLLDEDFSINDFTNPK